MPFSELEVLLSLGLETGDSSDRAENKDLSIMISENEFPATVARSVTKHPTPRKLLGLLTMDFSQEIYDIVCS